MPPKRQRKAPEVPVKGGWDVLPHNMGSVPSASGSSASLESTTRQLRPRKENRSESSATISGGEAVIIPSQAVQPTKRKRATAKTGQIEHEETDEKLKSKDGLGPQKPNKKARVVKKNPYGLTPDVQPQAPEILPAPSLEITGCGEVPSVLDALIRTLLSGATTFANAAKMLQGLVNKFGVLEDGIGKGSINWNRVRLSPMEDVVAAIREGGLAQRKASHIKGILDLVHQENEERRKAYLVEKETGVQADVWGAAVKTDGQKDLEILKTEKNILSLDHMRDLSAEDAMTEFTKFPGIGVKTAACVILFCLQRPCFAVDTHVHKFAKWLGWAPPGASENTVFSHLEVRCPDHLKYGLHQLFIRHGQVCGKCKRSTAEGTADWKAITCPLEDLLDRFDKRQTTAQPRPPKKQKMKNEDGDESFGSDGEESKVQVKRQTRNKRNVRVKMEENEDTNDKAATDLGQGDQGSVMVGEEIDQTGAMMNDAALEKAAAQT
ncbi:DNA glycosylase [Xylariaceae sp. FL0016]|nr:DNA glycosylase [Xylariaceae sp. FL0016]